MPKGRSRGGTDHKATAFEGACMPTTTLIIVNATDCAHQLCMACQKRSCYLSYASSRTCVILHEASEAAKPGHSVSSKAKKPRGPCLCSKDCMTQLLQLTTKGQDEDDDLHEVRGAQDNKAMKTHQPVAHIQLPYTTCDTLSVPRSLKVNIPVCKLSQPLNVAGQVPCVCKTTCAATCVCHMSMAAWKCHNMCGS